jgi:hypothetical protein
LTFKVESRAGDVIRSVETYSLLFKVDSKKRLIVFPSKWSFDFKGESRAGDVIRIVETYSLAS